MKNKMYRLSDGNSHLCISEQGEHLVFVQIFSVGEGLDKKMKLNLNNIKLIHESEIGNYQFLSERKHGISDIEFD